MSSEGITLAYDEYGQSGSPTLVILHGFFASSRNWRQIARTLAVHYHIYVLDLRNHGASGHYFVMDYPSMVEDVRLFLDEHHLGSAHILGHSMGGKVAMWFALIYPERINKLIVVDISPVSYRHSFDNLILALKQLPLDTLTNRKQADDLLSNAIPESSFRQFLLQNLILKENKYQWRINLDIFANNADHIIAFPETEEVDSYSEAVLFLAGETSSYITKASVSTLFPKAKIKTIMDAGHWVQAEQPQAFCLAVNEFLLG